MCPEGPNPSEGAPPPHLYGLPGLSPSDAEKVKLGNMLAVRCAEVADLCDQLKMPWLAEQPRIRESYPSGFNFTEWMRVRQRATTRHADLDQCRFADLVARQPSATYQKGTAVFGNMELREMAEDRKCDHTQTAWIRPSDRHKVTAAHPPLIGRERYVPDERWDGDLSDKAKSRYRAVK